MAERYENIPNVDIDLQDGRLAQETTPTGDVPIVIGTAKQGPTGVPTLIYSETQLLNEFGSVGSLVRGAAEMFQGGTRQLRVFRIQATPPEVKNIANPDKNVSKGYSVKMARGGADVLAQYFLRYDRDTDTIEITDGENDFAVVYRSVGGVVEVDTGVVDVSGEIGDASTYGEVTNIGWQLNVATDQADQEISFSNAGAATPPSYDAGSDTTRFSLNELVDGFNVARLTALGQVMIGRNFALSEIAVIVSCAGDTKVRQFELADLSKPGEIYITGDHVALLSDGDDVRFISKVVGVAIPEINSDRIENGSTGEYSVSIAEGNDYNGFPVEDSFEERDLTEVIGGRELTREEPEPHPTNYFEGLLDAARILETVPGNMMVMKDIHFDDPALDGQSTGEGKLPSTSEEGYVMSSAAYNGGTPKYDGVDAVSSGARALTLDGDITRIPVATDAGQLGDLDTAWNAFEAALEVVSSGITADSDYTTAMGVIRGPAPVAVTGAAITSGLEFDYLTALYAAYGNTADADVVAAKALLDAAWRDLYVAIETISAGITAVSGVASAASALRGEEAGSNVALWDATDLENWKATFEKAGRGECWVSVFTDSDSGDFGAYAEYPESLIRMGRILDWEYVDDGLKLKLDRELSFNKDAVGDFAASTQSFHIFKSRQLFFYRMKEDDGVVKHLWYHEKSDPEGSRFHEVNFGYELAQICYSRGLNDYMTQATIGVRAPSSIFDASAIARWIGEFPRYDEYGNVVRNGKGLLGNKFLAGRALDDVYDDAHQFEYGLQATRTGYLDDSSVLLDGNEFPIDLGKYLSVVVNWPVFFNSADSSGTGYVSSADAIYAGLTNSLPGWVAATQKPLAEVRQARLGRRLTKRQQNDLIALNMVVMDLNRANELVVVDARVASRKDSDFQREMTVRLTSLAIDTVREIALRYLGDPLTPKQKEGMSNQMQRALSDLQRQTGQVLEGFNLQVVQTQLDRQQGTATIALDLKVIEELRRVTVEVGLTPLN